MTVAAIVLAAGRSERMGRPKPLLPCGDLTFLETILATLGACAIRDVRVVLGHGAEEVRESIRLPDGVAVLNPRYDSGMLSSVRCGIEALPPGTTAFLLWPVDHPLVRNDTLARLVDALAESDRGIAIPTFGGRRGHPATFAARMAPLLSGAPDGVGARAVLRQHPDQVLEVGVEDPGVVTDIDTPDAYRRAFGRPLPSC